MILEQLSPEDRRQLNSFKRATRRFCRTIDGAHSRTEVDFLRDLNATLAEVWFRGQYLPDVDPWADETETSGEEPAEGQSIDKSVVQSDRPRATTTHMAAYWKARDLLDPLLGGHDYHRLVFDPYSPDEKLRESVTASLSDHLGDIYAAIKDELRKDRRPSTDEAFEPPYVRAWHWRFTFQELWGLYDVLPAINAISWLLYQYWDDDDGWAKVWQPRPSSGELDEK